MDKLDNLKYNKDFTLEWHMIQTFFNARYEKYFYLKQDPENACVMFDVESSPLQAALIAFLAKWQINFWCTSTSVSFHFKDKPFSGFISSDRSSSKHLIYSSVLGSLGYCLKKYDLFEDVFVVKRVIDDDPFANEHAAVSDFYYPGIYDEMVEKFKVLYSAAQLAEYEITAKSRYHNIGMTSSFDRFIGDHMNNISAIHERKKAAQREVDILNEEKKQAENLLIELQ